MIQIRNGIFETNSSSVHTIAVSKEPYHDLPSEKYFHLDGFGWENGYADPADYLYTAIFELYYENDREKFYECIGHIKSVLAVHTVDAVFHTPKDIDTSYDYYIDHAFETIDFVNAIMASDDLLMRYLFSDESFVHTGNDNDGNCPNEDEEFIYDYDFSSKSSIKTKNPDHHPDKFDYFSKGN